MREFRVEYTAVPAPQVTVPDVSPRLPAEVLKRRRERTCRRMREKGMDFFLIYADREHSANFSWLTGFDPRFEEAVLVLKSDGTATHILGNENIGMPEYVGMESRKILFPTFSLLDQPRRGNVPFREVLETCGIVGGKSVGICGWKYYTQRDGCSAESHEIPHWIVDAVKHAVSTGSSGAGGAVVNATSCFMSSSEGLRTSTEAEQVAVYEYACCLVSRAVSKALASVRPGMAERQAAAAFCSGGYPQSVHPMLSAGEKARWGLTSPSDNIIGLGDFLTSAYGLKGALIARAAHVAASERDLPLSSRSWLQDIAKPYFATAVRWYETLRAGVEGGEIYKLVKGTFPPEQYGWTLNPGHFIADDEWVSSPFFEGSAVILKSASYLQFDLIPDPPRPLVGANMEDGFLIADSGLRDQIVSLYPDLAKRFARRRAYLRDVLGIHISEDLLPLSDLAGFYQPFLLASDRAFVVA